MSYKEKPILKLYEYKNNSFSLKAIIDDYQECSFERNLYQAGNFTITINYNIPNAQLFQRGLFVQFGSDPYDFGEIISILDAISSDGKGSQIRTITGYDARYILKRRVIKNMNSNGLWVMTGKGEIVLRNLINDQCGAGAETKRQLPIINNIPTVADAIGKEYSVSEQFSNLYEVCKTIATQSEIGWRMNFNGSNLILECYEGINRAQTVQFSTSFDSLADGQFTDSSDSYSNAVYVGGKGQNDNRDIYEGEDGTPAGLDRYESWDNQSNMTTESEYEAEALSILTQYGQTITVSGNGLAKSPYIYKEEYNVGDIITLAFSGKSAVVQILNVIEHWSWGNYNISFSFGKPQNNLADQLQLILRKIQTASEKTESTDSVRWYTIPTDTEMPSSDVTYRTIGFIGDCGAGATFKLYLDNEKTGSKTYHIYFKQLAGGKLTLTTGVVGATNLVLNSGTYVAIVYVDENGNITSQGMTATNTVEAGNNQPVTSDAVNSAISGAVSGFVTGVKGDSEATYRTGNVNITKANIGLGNVDNTSDADKPVSTAQATAISTAETNAKDLANATGTLAIGYGGTNATTAKGAEFNIIGAVETVETTFDDNRFIAVRNQTISASNGSFRWFKVLNLWEYIKGKISSILGLTSTAYGGKASTAGTADNADKVNILTSNSSGDYPLLFTSGVTAGNKFVYTDTANEASYNPSTNEMKIGGSIYCNGYQLKTHYEIDASSLSTSNFYPVIFNASQLELDCEIHSPSGPGGIAYNQNIIHFLLTAQGWSDLPKRINILQYGVYASNEITLGSIAYGNQGGVNCIWVRGGMKYQFYCNRKPILKTADYTSENEKFTVGTSYSGGTNSNVTIVWTPDTRFVGAFSGLQSGRITGSNASKSLCDTVDINEAGSTVAKTASLLGFVLKKGSKLLVNLVNANTVANATLNVNGTGAKTVYLNGGNAITASNWTAGIWYAVYDGTYWRLDSARDAFYARNADFASSSDYTRGNAYCTTDSATAVKVASMRGFVLASGASFPITFTKSNTSQSALTLNINSQGAKSIYINNAPASSTNYTLPAGTYLCRYNGSYFEIDTNYAVTRARESYFAQTAETADEATTAGTATVANRVRIATPGSFINGDIWIS